MRVFWPHVGGANLNSILILAVSASSITAGESYPAQFDLPGVQTSSCIEGC